MDIVEDHGFELGAPKGACLRLAIIMITICDQHIHQFAQYDGV
jgi:hypothetical protein